MKKKRDLEEGELPISAFELGIIFGWLADVQTPPVVEAVVTRVMQQLELPVRESVPTEEEPEPEDDAGEPAQENTDEEESQPQAAETGTERIKAQGLSQYRQFVILYEEGKLDADAMASSIGVQKAQIYQWRHKYKQESRAKSEEV